MTDEGARRRTGAGAWPWSAFVAWGLGWWLLGGALAAGMQAPTALALAWAPSILLAWWLRGRWRRMLVLAGLPLALAVQQAASAWPAWAWLLPVFLMLALYPLSAWRDAPWFPTPPGALLDLAPGLALASDARILDAGSGLGHGLIALRRAFPEARLDGVERSALLAWGSRLRRMAGVRVLRQDLWDRSWADYDLVYMFQRPESMGSAWRKACREQRPGSWFVSLEFPVPGQAPTLQLEAGPTSQRPVYAYRLPPAAGPGPQPGQVVADIEEASLAAPPTALGKNPSSHPPPR